jgi:hypothetical protein
MAHELHEQIEHAGHAGGGRLAQFIGITVAILGVLMALCSAQLGAARTELVATRIEANDVSLNHQTISTKTLMLTANLQQLVALQADQKDLDEANAELAKMDKEEKSRDTALILKVLHLHNKKVLDTVTPTDTVMFNFAESIREDQKEAEAAKKWAESYKDAVEGHAKTADRFELALVCAEIGIVVASVGLLLAKQVWFGRAAWALAILLGLTSLFVASGTKIENGIALHYAEEKIEKAKEHYHEILAEKKTDEDEQMLKDLEERKKALEEKEKEKKS